MYLGRDKQRRQKRFKQRLITFAAITGIVITFYFLFFKTGFFSFDDGLSYNKSKSANDTISTYTELLDSTQKTEKKVSILKDTPVINVYKDAGKKTAISSNEDKKEVIVKKAESKKPDNPAKANRTFSKSVYKVISVAHFYNEPNEQTKRKAFINHWNNSYASIKPVDEKNGFVYVVFTNHLGQTSKGWLRKKDLKEVNTAYDNNKE